jgi:hypothetical protein
LQVQRAMPLKTRVLDVRGQLAQSAPVPPRTGVARGRRWGVHPDAGHRSIACAREFTTCNHAAHMRDVIERRDVRGRAPSPEQGKPSWCGGGHGRVWVKPEREWQRDRYRGRRVRQHRRCVRGRFHDTFHVWSFGPRIDRPAGGVDVPRRRRRGIRWRFRRV